MSDFLISRREVLAALAGLIGHGLAGWCNGSNA